MHTTTRSTVLVGITFILIVGLMGPTSATMSQWENFGVGWVNAGFVDEAGAGQNGGGNHAGQLRIASSTHAWPDQIRIRFSSPDDDPVPLSVWYLWIGCTGPDGETLFSRDLADTISDFTPPFAIKIFDSRIDGDVEGCHVNMEVSTTLYDNGLHTYRVKLQERRSLS